MRAGRVGTNFVRFFSIPQLKPNTVATTCPVSEEIFASLCYYADVPEVGKEVLAKRGIPKADIDSAFFAMQSFLRQSRAFYASASEAGPRASPLIWYYSFLNLAKAYLCLSVPQAVTGAVNHGLTLKFKPDSLDKQVVSVRDSGVFPLLYEAVCGDRMPKGVEFDVLSLLTYCSDISQEVEWLPGATHSTIPGISRAIADRNRKVSYAALAIPMFRKFELSDVGKRAFYENFDEVTYGNETLYMHEVFGLNGEIIGNFRFFETKKEFPTDAGGIKVRELEAECHQMLKPFVLENPYIDVDQVDFWLSRPFVFSGQSFPFNQLLSIYVTFYFLSSLVRYYPLYFEKQLATRDVWMIDTFTRSTPMTLLRLLANRIFGENRRYVQR